MTVVQHGVIYLFLMMHCSEILENSLFPVKAQLSKNAKMLVLEVIFFSTSLSGGMPMPSSPGESFMLW